jgi:hypothetical protein
MNDHLNSLGTSDGRGRRSRRRAYILIVVLGLMAVVTALGWAFLDANSTVMAEGVNWTATIRAQYLAESGAALGRHYLMYPPTTVACGGYWTGASNIAVDATSDYTNVSVVQSGTDPNLFTITAAGVARNPDGSISGTHTVTTQVLRPRDGKWHLCHAYLGASDDPMMPSTVHVQGNMHVNGYLRSYAWCPGNVSTSGALDWGGSGPPASLTSWAPPVPMPTANFTAYRNYAINGTTYNANIFDTQDMSVTDAITLNAQNWSTTNPGRVIYRIGDLRLKDGVSINGTLLVNGNLRIDKNNIVITAQPNFPAIVVTGYLYFEKSGDKATILGSVICGGGVWDNNTTTNFDITGTLVTGPGFYTGGTSDHYNITWDADRSTFWDFENGTGTRLPMTVLSWKDD